MLLKNKAPSINHNVVTTKTSNTSPKQFKKNVLKKSNLMKSGTIVTVNSVIGSNKITRNSEKEKVVGNIFIKKETKENDDPGVIVKETIFEVEKPKWDIINLSTTECLSEPGIYYKQEPLIKTFSDVLSTSNQVNSIVSISESDSQSNKLTDTLNKGGKKRKPEDVKPVLTKPTKVVNPKDKINETSPNGKLNKTIIEKISAPNTGTIKNVHFTLGSIVWAKAPGFCWWPAIVDDDPDIKIYYWYEGDSMVISHYHVTFLDDDVSRCWVSPKNIKIFFPDPQMKTINVKTCKKSHLKMMNKAIETAEKCLDLEPQERLNRYSFTVRFTGKSNIWARADVKKSNKPKTGDKFEALNIETSLLEAKSNVLVADSHENNEMVSHKNVNNLKVPKERKKTTKNKLPKQSNEE